MLNVEIKSHRQFLKSGTNEAQKLFVLFRFVPESAAAQSRSPVRVVLVVDTSGSMREVIGWEGSPPSGPVYQSDGKEYVQVSGGETKLERAIQVTKALVEDPRLTSSDQVAVIQFDDSSEVLLGLTPVSQRAELHKAIERLHEFDGGTQMAKGLSNARSVLDAEPPETVKRVIVLTDGQTFDEEQCLEVAGAFAPLNAPLVSLGVGDEYNHVLLGRLADLTQGRAYGLKDMGEFRQYLDEEIGASVREVVTNLRTTISAVKGVTLDRLTRIHPGIAEVSRERQPYLLGNAQKGEATSFVAEFTVAGVARPPSRARLAQVGFSFEVPGERHHGELPPHALWITFTDDERAVAQTDREVLDAVQQRNLGRIVGEAMRQATVNAAQARQTLQQAIGMTQRLGNVQATQLFQGALQELDQTGTLSVKTRKTVYLGTKTKTVSGTRAGEVGLTEEQIRQISGT